jgi:hypothetical protein
MAPTTTCYGQTNAPQAWSASSMFCLMQAMPGLYPYAPLHLLLIDPHLLGWLPDLTLERLRVGSAAVTIHFERAADGTTSYGVVDQHGPLHASDSSAPGR